MDVKKTEAYERGWSARLSDDPEPPCPYFPGSADYSQFVAGFFDAKPLEAPTWYKPENNPR